MLPVTRIGDFCGHPGVLISGSPDTTVNGIPNSTVTSLVLCFLHGVQIVVSGNPHHTVNGLNCSRIGSCVSCGSMVITGSPNTFTS